MLVAASKERVIHRGGSLEALPTVLLSHIEPIVPILTTVGVHTRVALDARAALHLFGFRLGQSARRGTECCLRAP